MVPPKERRRQRCLLSLTRTGRRFFRGSPRPDPRCHLPDWVVPVTIILLLVGLVVVGATAWVQGQPATDRREEAGEVPADWELDLPDLARSIRQGRLPHPTWTRALVGGAGAFLAVAVLATLVVLGGDGSSPGPGESAAEPAAPGLAVLPFSVSGGDLDVWREGMVDLLSRNLDGLGDLRAIDSRTVLARWREVVGDGEAPDLATTLAAARRTGARWALVGSAVGVGPRVRLSGDVREVETGRRIERATLEGSPDSLLSMVDRLSVQVARSLLSREDPALAGLRLSSITTASPEALRAFLEGEAAYRRSSFRASAEAYERAVALDPSFALAWYRLASARGWVGDGALSARTRAHENRGRLPAREALLVEAEYRARRGALPAGVALLRDGVRRYPDDPEMWYQLGDVYLHYGLQLLVGTAEAERALERAVELDPDFSPYQIHLVDLALVRGDTAEAAARLAREKALAGEATTEVRAHQLQFDYLYGSAADRERVLAAIDTLDPATASWVRLPFSLEGEMAGRVLELANEVCQNRLEKEIPPDGGFRWNCFYTMLANGRIRQARHYSERMKERGMLVVPSVTDLALRQSGMDPSAPLMDPESILARPGPPAGLVDPALLAGGALAAAQGRDSVLESVVRVLADSTGARTAEGDTLSARIIAGLGEGLKGIRALAGNRAEAALEHLEQAHEMIAGGRGPEVSFLTHVAWLLAELYERQGRDRDALRYLESLGGSHYAAPALLRRADINERLGEVERARALRRAFLVMWSGADPDHPLVQRASQGLPQG
jgi:TolB-like protein